jgi:hypothetical protein
VSKTFASVPLSSNLQILFSKHLETNADSLVGRFDCDLEVEEPCGPEFSEDGIVLLSGDLEIISPMAAMVLLASPRFVPFAASEALGELGSTVDTRRRTLADSWNAHRVGC